MNNKQSYLSRIPILIIILFLCTFLGLLTYWAFFTFVMPKETISGEYTFDKWDITVIETKIQLIGVFPERYIIAKRNDLFFSDEQLIYSTEIFNDSLSLSFEKPNILHIDAYDNDMISYDYSCGYLLGVDTLHCNFNIGGNSSYHRLKKVDPSRLTIPKY